MLKGILKNKYKIIISIIFGLIGFYVNFQTIIFPFGDYSPAILLGLFFPMLIALSWGWKYGLLSALAGGCQTVWWLWGPSNGYAILFVAPPFTLWIIWHGFWAKQREKQKSHKWWLSMYVVEIPFRILNSINLLTLSRWAITLNPPSWSWASNAANTIPLHFSVFVSIKQAVVGFVILLFADVFLNIKFVRSLFKLKEYIEYKKTGYIISFFLLLGCLFWLLDSVFYSFAFNKEGSFIDLLALNIPDYNIFIRSIFFVFSLVSGLFTSRIVRKQRKGEVALRKNNENFQRVVSNITIVIWKADIGVNGAFENSYFSPALDELLELPAGTMKNNWYKYFDYIKPEYLERVNNAFREAIILPGKKIDLKYEVLKDNGQTAWFNTIGKCFEKNGKSHVFGSTMDITEHIQAEQELNNYREHLEELVKERTIELKDKNKKLEELNELFVNREFRIKELKDKVKELEGKVK